MISFVFFRSRKIVNMLSWQSPTTFNYYPLSLTSGVLQLILLKRSLFCSVILSRKPWANSKLILTAPNCLGLQAVNIWVLFQTRDSHSNNTFTLREIKFELLKINYSIFLIETVELLKISYSYAVPTIAPFSRMCPKFDRMLSRVT